MKIRHQLQITIVGIALTFGLLGFIEQRNIDHLAEAFQSLDSHNGSSSTALLELLAATRYASILAVEYSRYGIPADRAATLEAIQRIELEFSHYQELGEHGCMVALDDFGTGMSSFSYLKSLEVDFVKIDGGFVRSMLEDRMHHAIGEAINNIVHIAGIQTIAEFVENQSILDRRNSRG